VATLIVPEVDLSFPTLGPQLKAFIEERAVFGPGSLAGRPAKLDPEKVAALYRLYEVFPQGHRLAGQRRFQRGAIEWAKGLAKTEFAAWVAFAELHPEGPVRCDGFDAYGQPVGRPVDFPYIPMMAVTEGQVSDLAYAVLRYVVEEGPDGDLFDVSLDRILRLGARGQEDGKALPVAGAPSSRDGALTTFQHFDEPHRLVLPSSRAAHETMMQNLTKRQLEDPWALYTSTAGQPGQNSVQEDVRAEAEEIAEGLREDPSLFFFARWAGDHHDDLSTVELRMEAVAEARGPAGEYGPGQIERIARDYDRKGVDKAYWERTQLNRWRKSGSQAFDIKRIADDLATPGLGIPKRAFVTIGFDGARFRDATGFVITEVATGRQQLVGGWERDEDVEDWEVDEAEVTATLEHIMKTWDVALGFFDPPHWTETVGSWAARWPDKVEEWWTNRPKTMAYGLRSYVEAIDSGSISYVGTDDQVDDLVRHLGQAGKKELKIKDDEGQPLWILAKQDGKRELKLDFAMASVLSWLACLDVRKRGLQPSKPTASQVPMKIR